MIDWLTALLGAATLEGTALPAPSAPLQLGGAEIRLTARAEDEAILVMPVATGPAGTLIFYELSITRMTGGSRAVTRQAGTARLTGSSPVTLVRSRLSEGALAAVLTVTVGEEEGRLVLRTE